MSLRASCDPTEQRQFLLLAEVYGLAVIARGADAESSRDESRGTS